MKHTKLWTRVILVVVCLTTVISMISCVADMEIGNNTELGEQFLSYVINDDYDAAYALIKNTVNTTDFSNYWANIHFIAEGATAYDMEQIGWNINLSNGLTTRVAAYQVYFDNGKTALFRIVTRDDIDGIAGLHFSDVTDFLRHTDTFVPAVKIVLLVISVLSFAFVIWMFVDCLRRKIKYKVIWAILILFGFAFTITAGEQTGLNFALRFMIQRSTIAADPSIASVIIKLVVPVGAILYICLRKKITVVPSALTNTAENIEAPVTDSVSETEDTPISGEAQESNETNE